MTEPRHLSEVLPELCAEVCELLRGENEHEVARAFPNLPFLRWCDCEDDFCQGFYTAPKPNGSYGPAHRMIALSTQGMINLDLVGSAVMYVEVIDRPEVKTSFRSS